MQFLSSEMNHWNPCLLYIVVAVLPYLAMCDNSSSTLENAVRDLKSQVSELQKARQEDKATLELLLREVSLYGTEFHLSMMESASIADHSREWSNRKAEELKSNRKLSQHLEIAMLRRDLAQYQKRLDSLETEAKREFSTRAIVRWLQQSIEDLRHEIVEMATSLNITAALTDQQRVQSQQDLIRSDLAALGHRMERNNVERETNAARIQQLQRDLQELRNWGQKEEEKRTLQNLFPEEPKHLSEIRTTKRVKDVRHSRRKAEIFKLYQSVKTLENQQSKIFESMKAYQQMTSLKVKAVERTCSEVMEARQFEQQRTNQRITALEGIVNRTESHLDIRSLVRNVTSNLKKMDEPTMQALESLESNFERTTAVILQEISKLDNNLSKTQSAVKDIHDRQIVTNDIISNIQTDVRADQPEMARNFPNSPRVLKSEYEDVDVVEEKKSSDLEAQIDALFHDIDQEKTDIEALKNQMSGKVDKGDYSGWKKTEQKVRESILELKEEVPKIQKHQKSIESKLEKFTKQLPADCSMLSGPSLILLDKTPTRVFCEDDWLVVQRRAYGNQSFKQNWMEYKAGFGNVEYDFWLGNDLLHRLTTSRDHLLRIDLWDITNQYRYAEYSTFRVLDESDNYRLVLDGYQGNASNAMAYHNGKAFSTPDRDNDASIATHCAQFYGSGWWFSDCQYVNINGIFNMSMSWYNRNGQEWSELSKVEMKIKPK